MLIFRNFVKQEINLHMAGVFRFSNAVSDISKFIQTYKSIYQHFIPETSQGHYFDHKDAYQFLASTGLASSLGAIGAEAIRRSERDDTSRDPLYNQHKMYSEMYRMLGWYEPGTKKTNFNLPEYGDYIANFPDNVVKVLFGINVLHIVSPNPLTAVKGGNVLRPFPLLLKIMNRLGGVICRDEMILTVLACPSDQDPSYIQSAVDRILNLRARGHAALKQAISDMMNENDMRSMATLQNYTRFPIATLKWMEWAQSENLRNIYRGTSVTCLKLTEAGSSLANSLETVTDIRFEALSQYSNDAVAAFVIWSNLYQLKKAGFRISDYQDEIRTLEAIAEPILTDYSLSFDSDMLFFGYQEAPRAVLALGNSFIEE